MSQSRTKCHIIFLTKFKAVCFCCCCSLQQTMTILKSSDVILFNSDSPQNSGKTGVVNSQRKLLHAVQCDAKQNTHIVVSFYIREDRTWTVFLIHSQIGSNLRFICFLFTLLQKLHKIVLLLLLGGSSN